MDDGRSLPRTKTQLNKWAREGALAVEMQAASLFAFGVARQAPVASVAMVSNAVDHAGAQFDTAHRRMASEFSRGSLEQPDLSSPLRDLSNLIELGCTTRSRIDSECLCGSKEILGANDDADGGPSVFF